jgi:hypothetical protein
MKFRRQLILAALAAQLFIGTALAVNGGSFTLVPGGVHSVSVSATDRAIHVCNQYGSMGDLVIVVSGSDPIRLAPGICKWESGDSITFHNDSKASVTTVFEVVGKHQ